MAWGYVETVQTSTDSAGSSVVSPTFTGVTLANAISYFCTYNHSSSTTVTITRGSDSSIEIGNFWDSGSGYGARWGVIYNAAAGTTAVTATYGTSVTSWRGIFVTELSGLATTTAIYTTGEFAGAYLPSVSSGTDTWATSNITPGVQPICEIALGMDINGGSLTAGTGFTDRGVPGTYGYGGTFVRLETRNRTSLSAAAATWSTVGGFGMAMSMLLREPVAAAARNNLLLLGVG